jgi:hypothetical protein
MTAGRSSPGPEPQVPSWHHSERRAQNSLSRHKAPRVPVLLDLHPELGRADPLKWRSGDAILKPLSVSIVLTQPSCRLVIQRCMKSSTSVLALRSLPALEAIGSNSGLVAPAT